MGRRGARERGRPRRGRWGRRGLREARGERQGAARGRGRAGRGGCARRRSGRWSAPAGQATRQLPAVGGAERRRRGEGTGGGGRRGRKRGGAGPLVSAAPLLSSPREEEEERGQPPPPPSQPRPAHLSSPRRPGSPRRAPRHRRPARAQRCLGAPAGRVPRAASRSPAARVAAPLCAAAAAPGLLGLGSQRPSGPDSRAPPPGNPSQAPPTVDLAAARRRAPAPASPSLSLRPRARLRHGCEVLPRSGRGPRRPGLRAVPGVLRLQQGDRAGLGPGAAGRGPPPCPGRAPHSSSAPPALFFSLFPPLSTPFSLCAFVSDQLSSSTLPAPRPPPFCPSAGAPLCSSALRLSSHYAPTPTPPTLLAAPKK